MPVSMQIRQIVLRKYEILDLIGNGAQYDVAKATDQQSGQVVVIKQLSASPFQPDYSLQKDRFLRAASLSFNHPRIADPVEHGEEDGELYVVLPFVEGVDLEIFLQKCGGKLPLDQAKQLVLQIADTLGCIHRHGIVHRDIKPLNIIIAPNGDPYLIDFGICRNIHQNTITTSNGLLGTPLWMAPEQAIDSRNVDGRADLFCLGLIMYELLTGARPIRGDDTSSIIHNLCHDHPVSPQQIDGTIPPHLDATCMRLLAKDPGARFQTAEELCQALNNGQSQRFCPSCGNPRQPNARFCGSCGADHNATAVVVCLACRTAVDRLSSCPGCQRPFSPADHRLVGALGTLIGQTFRVPEGIYDVGRPSLSPRDFNISKCHFRVACSNGTVTIQDAGSVNKTYVAGQLANRPIVLAPNQEVCIAGNLATYVSN